MHTPPLAILVISLFAAAPAKPGAATMQEESTRPQHQGATLPTFSAHYDAEWRSINVGTSDLSLREAPEPGRHVYTWTIAARGVFRVLYTRDVTQTSWFSVIGEHVRPQRYRADDGSSSVSLNFDWVSLRALGTEGKKPIDLQLTQGTQDLLSIQAEVMLDLQNGAVPESFHIIDKDELKEFIYARDGSANIRTALGAFDTVIVSSQRKGGNTILRMWFAPSLGYIPLQAERTRDGTLEFAMRIKSLKSSAK